MASTKRPSAGVCSRQPEASKGQRSQLQDDRGRLSPQEGVLVGKGGEPVCQGCNSTSGCGSGLARRSPSEKTSAGVSTGPARQGQGFGI